jgi:site-specific DNA-methyltransferase (adenine-specific)
LEEYLNKTHQMDCLDGMKLLPDKSIDMILSDLPYGTTDVKWDSVIDLEELWSAYKRIIKPGGAIVLTASQPFTSILVMSNIKWFKVEWVWEKNAGSNFGTVKYQPMKEHESVLVFGKGKVTYNPIMQERAESGKQRTKHLVNYKSGAEVYEKGNLKNEVRDNKLSELRYPRSIQKFNRERGLHPTQKPVALFEYLIKTYSNEGDVILDNCMGSGTTGVAALRTKRSFIGFERESKYVKIANQRIENVKDEIAERKLTEEADNEQDAI